MSDLKGRLLSKPSASVEFQEEYEAQNRNVYEIHEDSSIGSMQKLPEERRLLGKSVEVAENLSAIDFISHGFFGRHGGVSKVPHASLNTSIKVGDDYYSVMENRRRIAATFGLPVEKMVIPYQVHSDIAVFIDSSQTNNIECDAIITNSPGLLIGITCADCVPILVCDVKKHYIAAIHSGWRGALSGIIERTFEKLVSFGCTDLICAIGPCIQQESFGVSSEITEKVSDKYINNRHFDIPLYVHDKLISCGATDVSKIDIDTFSNEEYFSYRRQIHKENGYGAQFSGIMLLTENEK